MIHLLISLRKGNEAAVDLANASTLWVYNSDYFETNCVCITEFLSLPCPRLRKFKPVKKESSGFIGRRRINTANLWHGNTLWSPSSFRFTSLSYLDVHPASSCHFIFSHPSLRKSRSILINYAVVCRGIKVWMKQPLWLLYSLCLAVHMYILCCTVNLTGAWKWSDQARVRVSEIVDLICRSRRGEGADV